MPTRAPSRCNEPGCYEIATLRGRCEEHQRKPWQGRPSFVDQYGMTTGEWSALRRVILARDGYVCRGCGLPGADTVDHIIPVSEGGSPRDPANLQALHEDPCHAEKSKAEAKRGAARARARRAAAAS